MSLNLKRKTPMKVFLFISISFFMLVSLVGFRDIKKEGIECKFQARIVDIENPPPDQKVLVVNELPIKALKGKEKVQKIYVIVSSETIIGSKDSILKFSDLHLGMGIEIQGRKVIDRENGEENTVVLAKRIRPLIE